MSTNYIDPIIIPANMVRDFLYTSTAMAAQVHDVPVCFNIVGLDVFIHNRGAAALTIAFNGQTPVTVNAGDTYTINDFKFWLVAVASAVLYDLQIFGVRITTLERLGVLKRAGSI